MVNENYFINEAIDIAMNKYIKIKSSGLNISAVNLDVNIISLLCTIFDENDLINAYINKNEDIFNNILTKYNFPKERLNEFYQKMEELYIWEKEYNNKTNLITEIHKYIIAMINYKNEVTEISDRDLKNYEKFMYLSGTRDFYNKINSINPDEIKEYWQQIKSHLQVKIQVNRASPTLLTQEQYESFGINHSEVKALDDSQKDRLNKLILQKELENNEVSGGITNQKENVLQYVLNPKNVTSGAGFVDKLLLLGIIATISMIAYVAYVYFGR